MDSFTKKATNVGGCIGFVIPYEVAYKEGIKKGTTVRVILEVVADPQEQGRNGRCGTLTPNLLDSPFSSAAQLQGQGNGLLAWVNE